MTFRPEFDRAPRQPAFNLPRVVVVLLALMVGIQLLRAFVLTDSANLWVIVNFAFIPGFMGVDAVDLATLPVDILPGARMWSFVTYAFLHGGWAHLLLNCIWMAAFASPLAWRFGTTRFLLFSAVGAIAGALVHWAAYGNDISPLVGASAAISAHMAGAVRFLFIGGNMGRRDYFAPAAPLRDVFSDRSTLSFIAIWFGISIAIGLIGLGGEGAAIAWQAHIGGFLAGLLLFPLFDPVGRPSGPDVRAPS